LDEDQSGSVTGSRWFHGAVRNLEGFVPLGHAREIIGIVDGRSEGGHLPRAQQEQHVRVLAALQTLRYLEDLKHLYTVTCRQSVEPGGVLASCRHVGDVTANQHARLREDAQRGPPDLVPAV
jgi:hypothetical protein